VEKAVVVVGSKETLLMKSDRVWTGTVDAADASADAKLVLTIAGKERTAAFPSGWNAGAAPAAPAVPAEPAPEAPAPPAPPPPEEKPGERTPPSDDEGVKKTIAPEGLLADEEPVNPPDPHPEPAGKPGPANPPSAKTDSNASEARVALEGSFLLAIPGTEARLEVLHDKNAGKLTVQPVKGEVAFLLDEPPVLFLASKEPAGVGKATLNRLEGKPVWWVIHTELKDRDVFGKLRLTIAGKTYDVDLAGPHLRVSPGAYVVLGTTRADVDLDRTAGMMAVRAGSQLQSLTFIARSADGRSIPIVLTPVPGSPGHFRATNEAFRAARLDGRFTARIEGRDVEGALQTGARTDGAGAAAAGSGTTGAGATGSGTTSPPPSSGAGR
jgi:hypothetical protein